MRRTGFIGLGSQGGPMAQRMLAAGFPLMVWARRPQVLEPFVAQGAQAAGSVSELGEYCDHIGICVVNDAGVAEICDQLIPAMRPGSLLAMHSTVLPQTCEDLARRCTERDILFIDAPVSGGGGAAADGTLTVMCGGEATACDQARPVFASFARSIFHLGPAGSAQRAKIVNNALLAANIGLAHAALQAGAGLGIDRAALTELIKASSGRSFGFDVCARLPNPQAFAMGAALLVKDVRLLDAILPDNANTAMLHNAAAHFMDEASGEPL